MSIIKRIIKKNNLIFFIGSVVFCTFCLTGCTSKIAKNAIEEGNMAIASMEYEKALGLFTLAINEGVKDKEIIKLNNILKVFVEAERLNKENKNEEAYDKLKEIENEYDSISFKNDLDRLKVRIEESLQIDKEINEVNDLVEAKDYLVAKEKIDLIKIKSINELQEKKVSMLNTKIEESINAPNLVLNYKVNESNEDISGTYFKDGSGEIRVVESDYFLNEPIFQGEKRVTSYKPKSYIIFKLENIGKEAVVNPVIDFSFNGVGLAFKPGGNWKGVTHINGVGMWQAVRWQPQAGFTIQNAVPSNFTLSLADAQIRDGDTSVQITVSGDNCEAKKFTIPIILE